MVLDKKTVKTLLEAMLELGLIHQPIISNEVPSKPTLREIKQWDGEPPQGQSGKFLTTWRLKDRCGVEYTIDQAHGVKARCEEFLYVSRIKNTKFIRDESGYGGQLEYNDKDVKQYVFCPHCGPFPPGPESW